MKSKEESKKGKLKPKAKAKPNQLKSSSPVPKREPKKDKPWFAKKKVKVSGKSVKLKDKRKKVDRVLTWKDMEDIEKYLDDIIDKSIIDCFPRVVILAVKDEDSSGWRMTSGILIAYKVRVTTQFTQNPDSFMAQLSTKEQDLWKIVSLSFMVGVYYCSNRWSHMDCDNYLIVTKKEAFNRIDSIYEESCQGV